MQPAARKNCAHELQSAQAQAAQSDLILQSVDINSRFVRK
jgi:hypothetical protein